MKNIEDKIKSFVSKEWLRDNWFKVSVLIILIAGVVIAYNVLIIQPKEERERETLLEQQRIAKEEQRKENLDQCLEESEYKRTATHLATCGDPNIGRASSSCFEVFSSADNYFDVYRNYLEEFPEASSKADIKADAEIEEFFDKCNCGLEKYRRDELDKEKERRDEICFQKYGK